MRLWLERLKLFWTWLQSGGGPEPKDPIEYGIELPWRPRRWGASSGRPPPSEDVEQRAVEVARATLGEAAWDELQSRGYVDVPSGLLRGLTYRIRVGHRLELIWDGPEDHRHSPWHRGCRYLCVDPTYPLPAVEFAAHLYLYLRDQEEVVIRVAKEQVNDASPSYLL